MTKSSEWRCSSLVAQAGVGRKTWKKFMMPVSIALLAAVIGAGISGCGGSGPTPGPTPTPTPTPTPNPVPAITTLSPGSAVTGGLAFTLTVHGSNFIPVSTVEWNGSSRTTTFISSSQLQAHIMSADLASAAKVPITVINPAPGGGTSNATNFNVPAATITFRSARALSGSDAANTNNVSNVWVMNPDGSAVVPLTKTTAAGSDSLLPAWSPDGSKIAFASSRALNGSDAANTNSTFNIWVANADGSGATPLTKLTVAKAFSIGSVWSPDGSKIAFTSDRALDGSDAVNTNSTFNIWVVNADGSGATPLTKLTAAGTSNSATWSPDGGKIAFQSQRALDGSDAPNTINSVFNIWVMNADGSGATPLTNLTAQGGGSFDPAWSPDGRKLAFDSARALDGSNAINTNSATNIWVMNADGSAPSPLTKLTALGEDSSVLLWSPDGNKLAFTSSRAVDGSDAANVNKTSNLWVMNADGSSVSPLTKLTAAGASSFDGIWSPDGSKLFFDSTRALDGSDAVNTNRTSNIWVVNTDGSGAVPLTKLTAAGADSFAPKQP